MEKDSSIRSNNTVSGARDKSGGEGSLLLRASSDGARQGTTSDLVLQWGNRKRLRCMKVQVKDDSSGPVQRTTVRVDRRVVRTDKDSLNKPTFGVNNNTLGVGHTHNNNNNNHHHNQSNGYPNLRQRPSSPQQRILSVFPSILILRARMVLVAQWRVAKDMSINSLKASSTWKGTGKKSGREKAQRGHGNELKWDVSTKFRWVQLVNHISHPKNLKVLAVSSKLNNEEELTVSKCVRSPSLLPSNFVSRYRQSLS
ncbi:hypothetical protein V8G54_007445 [Vigna mungo]|uniref:Uncharacterized protein n=1 Tax=Vigna mungo TaxID=3915 RepID=A0AAQ3P5G4_VIGMU